MLDTKPSPLFDVLMEREERQGQSALTPEQRAALDARLKTLVARIGDVDVRRHYETELKATLWEKNRKATRDLAGFNGRRDVRFAGKRRNNTQLDWRVAERARADGRQRKLPRGVNPASLAVRSNELAERTLPLPARETLLIAHPPQPPLAAGGPVRGGCRAGLDLAAPHSPARRPARAAGAGHRP